MRLTGNRRFRVGFGKTLVLQVEQTYLTIDQYCDTERVTEWRDAKIEDLTELANEVPSAP